jgi:endo-1,4-beta-D-glucanase Y
MLHRPRASFLSLGLACLVIAGCANPDRDSGTPGNGGNTGTGARGGNGIAGAGGTGVAGAGIAGSPGRGGDLGGVAGSGSAGSGGGAAGATGSAGRGGSVGLGGGGSGGARAGSGGGAGTSAPGGTGGASGGSAGVVIRGKGSCMAPAGANVADAAAAYAKWKTDLLVTEANGRFRVRRPNSSGAVANSTVSEGIAYGMLLSVYANDQPTFDGLWLYSQDHLDENKLMHWYIGPDGSVLGTGAASDGDEDMAFALIVADARWGGKGSLNKNYIELAKTQIDLMWQHEVDHTRGDVFMAGDQFNGGEVINISYFAPAFYRAFGRVTGKTSDWNKVVESTYSVLAKTLNTQNGNANNGLVPAWSTPAGVPMSPPGANMPTNHQLDSCRTPFRLAQDYCWNAEPRALSYLQKISSFYSTVTVAAMVDAYDLNGTPRPSQVTTGGPRQAAFVGPAGAGAMATGTTYTKLRDEAYASVATLMQLAGSTYYQESWTGLSLQLMTGIMYDPGVP